MATAGSNGAYHAIAQVLCDSGAEVILPLPLPYVFNHVMATQLAGGRFVAVSPSNPSACLCRPTRRPTASLALARCRTRC